jgi:choline dehydrogenase-like flavoprotein
MRFGADFRADPPAGVTVITEATVTGILSDDAGRVCTGLALASLAGRRAHLGARACVLTAGAVENARLLLLSRPAGAPNGLGNENDCVGRYLTDHPTATVARAAPGQIADMAARFGLFGLRAPTGTHVYMHGLALDAARQRAARALNGAVFVTEERAPDDPFAALGRLARRRSTAPLGDLLSVARSPWRLVRGVGARALERGYLPAPVTRATVNLALRFFPNAVARDYRFGKLPLKLAGLRFEATSEQPPLAENRVTLSETRDPLGLPRARVAWSPGDAARANLRLIGAELDGAVRAAGLPPLLLEPWVAENRPEAAVAIDLGHSMGTTRMSADPREGVVDRDCAVHGVDNLYVAGGSVLPTSGHANPTLMMLALALRLADTLADRLAPPR